MILFNFFNLVEGNLFSYWGNMIKYIDILNDDKVIENYNKIDAINPFLFNHGLKHVKNVCNIMDKLCDKLDITWEEKDALLIAWALHDIGQVDGRDEHWKKAKLFTISHFENELKDLKYYNDILKSIENHDNVCDLNNPLFWILIQFCDKMDFSKDRLENNYREKFRYYCYEDINRIDFIFDEKNFGIDIITNDIPDFNNMFLSENFPKKVINAVNILALKLNKEPIIKHNWEVMLDSNDFIL